MSHQNGASAEEEAQVSFRLCNCVPDGMPHGYFWKGIGNDQEKFPVATNSYLSGKHLIKFFLDAEEIGEEDASRLQKELVDSGLPYVAVGHNADIRYVESQLTLWAILPPDVMVIELRQASSQKEDD